MAPTLFDDSTMTTLPLSSLTFFVSSESPQAHRFDLSTMHNNNGGKAAILKIAQILLPSLRTSRLGFRSSLHLDLVRIWLVLGISIISRHRHFDFALWPLGGYEMRIIDPDDNKTVQRDGESDDPTVGLGDVVS